MYCEKWDDKVDNKSLQLFLTLADTLHFGRCSAVCHVSPSTLSRCIQQLEEELGAPLFIRDNRSVTLTPEGLTFQRYARDALLQWDTLRSSLLAQRNELQGEISIYCSVTASYSFLYEILSSFRRDYPRIEIKLHTGDPAEAVRRVQQGEEDIAIGAKPDQLPVDIAFRPITRSPLVFIAPAEPAQLSQELNQTPSAERWRQVPMILSEAGLARKRTDRWFRHLGIKPLIYAQVAGNEAIVSMVSLGFGVGVVPQIVLENNPLASRVIQLDIHPALEAFEVGIFTQEKKLRHPLIKAFWQQQSLKD